MKIWKDCAVNRAYSERWKWDKWDRAITKSSKNSRYDFLTTDLMTIGIYSETRWFCHNKVILNSPNKFYLQGFLLLPPTASKPSIILLLLFSLRSILGNDREEWVHSYQSDIIHFFAKHIDCIIIYMKFLEVIRNYCANLKLTLNSYI